MQPYILCTDDVHMYMMYLCDVYLGLVQHGEKYVQVQPLRQSLRVPLALCHHQNSTQNVHESAFTRVKNMPS